MNIAICDDEKIVRLQIKGLIEKQKADGNLELYETGEELLAVLRFHLQTTMSRG